MVSDSGKNFSRRKLLTVIELKNIQTSFKTITGERRENYSMANTELLEQFEQLERNLKQFKPESPSKLNMGNKDRDKNQGDSGETSPAPGMPTMPRDLSQEREARDATLAKQVAKAIAREMPKAHMHYQALLNEKGTAAMPTSLKMTSGALGFKDMDPFDWTKDKAIYQRWQMRSEKVRHALDATKGDSEKTKISYFHHWIDSKGMAKIESWKNKKVLISQEDYENLEKNEKEGKYFSEKIESYFTLFELLLAPKSNPLLAVEELHFAKQGSMNS